MLTIAEKGKGFIRKAIENGTGKGAKHRTGGGGKKKKKTLLVFW